MTLCSLKQTVCDLTPTRFSANKQASFDWPWNLMNLNYRDVEHILQGVQTVLSVVKSFLSGNSVMVDINGHFCAENENGYGVS